MTRHFRPTVSERKDKRNHQKRGPAYSPKKQSKMNVWVLRLNHKPTDSTQTYFLTLEQTVDPNLLHEKINQIIPNTEVSVVNPQSPQSFFIIELCKPLTLSEIYSKTNQALKGML